MSRNLHKNQLGSARRNQQSQLAIQVDLTKSEKKTKKVQVGKRNGRFSFFFSKKTHEAENFRKLSDGKRFLSSFLSFIQKTTHACSLGQESCQNLNRTICENLEIKKLFAKKRNFAETFRFQSTIKNFVPSIYPTQQSLIYTQNL